jgi:hypothetical protein
MASPAASSLLSGERGAVLSEHAAAAASSRSATRWKERLAIMSHSTIDEQNGALGVPGIGN